MIQSGGKRGPERGPALIYVLMACDTVRLWYLEPGKTFGFADASEGTTERRRGADTAEGRLRLSWHLDGQGGYRAGYTECLNHDTSWRKLIFSALRRVEDGCFLAKEDRPRHGQALSSRDRGSSGCSKPSQAVEAGVEDDL